MSSGPKKCGKCDKTVYPTEEIKCLDKFWHKGCFKCTVCGTTLNIKNAKGYEKMPYCNVHYPQPKPTVIADNPEMQRIRQLSDIQSNAKYHKDFNESKGKFTVVADDPATTRAKEQQRNVSQAEYTGKRKESTSQVLAPDNHQQTNENTNQGSNTSEPTVGRVADYDPIRGEGGSLARGYEPTSKALHDEDEFQAKETNIQPTPLKSEDDNHQNEKRNSHQQNEEIGESSSKEIHHDDQSKEDSHGDTQSKQVTARALYSYVAAEADEISFNEGDTLIECEQIDDGWMLGKNAKTGQQGLLPSNYVEILN